MNDIYFGAPSKKDKDWLIDVYMTQTTVQATEEHRRLGIFAADRADADKPLRVDWGDGEAEELESISQKVHEYSSPGKYTAMAWNISAFTLGTTGLGWNQVSTDNAAIVEEVSIGKYVKTVARGFPWSLEQGCFCGLSSLKSLKFADATTTLGISAAAGCTSLSSVEFSDDLSSIPNNAFMDCTSLSALELPKSLKTIGYNAFQNTRLSRAVVPKGTEVIGSHAFSYNPDIREVYIPSTLTACGYGAFAYDTGLSAVHITDLDAWCKIYFDGDTGDDKSIGNPLRYARNLYLNGKLVAHVDIPSGMSAVGQYMFWNGSCISSVNFPEGLKSIEKYAFVNCSLTGEIDIPHGVTYVGNAAFGGNKFSSINIPDTVTYFGSGNCTQNQNLTSLYIPDSVTNEFTGCQGAQNLRTVYIGENVPGIGMNAFYYCQQLSSIHLGQKVSYIGNAAFFDCPRLSSIDLPAALTSIGDQGFYGARLTSLALPENLVKIGDNGFSGNRVIGHLELPSKLSSIGHDAFSNSQNLSSVSIPSSLSSIGPRAFADCTSMREFFVDEDNPNYKAVDGMLLAKDGKTLLGGVVGSVQIPDGVEAVGPGAFSAKPELISVQIPGTVTAIQDTAFAQCQGLTSVTVPASVQSIGYRAFYYSRNIEYFEFLGDAPANVGGEAFSGYWRQVIAKIPADPALWAGYSDGDMWNGLKIERKAE